MKSAKRILCAFLAVLTLLTLAAAGSVRPAYAAKTAAELEEEQRKAAQIAALEQKKKEQQKKLKELEKQIAEARAKKEDVMVTKNLLDQRNQLLLEQIDDTQNQIDDAAAQIARYELLEQEQYELFCQQVRSEEERGTLSYWSVLFKASSFTDLLSRIDFVNEVAEHDKSVIATLQDLRAQIQSDKDNLESQKSELETRQAELTEQRAEADKLYEQLSADASQMQKMAAAEEASADRIEQEIKNRQETPPTPATSGDYIWPCSARYITSPFGRRTSPGGIGSRNHKGVDIGASYGSSIYATKAGTVIVSSYDAGGYGNYVQIDHGGGNYTLYGHMSKRLVSVGQTVSQGGYRPVRFHGRVHRPARPL